jgi:hypothetical protein
MKHVCVIVALIFGFSGTNAMNHESRVRLSEKKLVKDDLAEFHQSVYRNNIIMSGGLLGTHLALLGSKKIRRGSDARINVPFVSCLAMGYAFLLYKSVKDYNLAKQGLREHRELIVE